MMEDRRMYIWTLDHFALSHPLHIKTPPALPAKSSKSIDSSTLRDACLQKDAVHVLSDIGSLGSTHSWV